MAGNPYNGFSWDERMAAFRWLKAEYKAGRAVRPTVCEACGQDEGVIEAHNEDYSFPYGAHTHGIGLCFRCHMMVHCRFRAPAAWGRYRAAVRAGLRAPPLFTRNFGEVCRMLAGGRVEYEQHSPPLLRVLDEIDDGRYLNRGQPRS